MISCPNHNFTKAACKHKINKWLSFSSDPDIPRDLGPYFFSLIFFTHKLFLTPKSLYNGGQFKIPKKF